MWSRNIRKSGRVGSPDAYVEVAAIVFEESLKSGGRVVAADTIFIKCVEAECTIINIAPVELLVNVPSPNEVNMSIRTYGHAGLSTGEGTT
jgi:hypothetical protein